MSCTSGSTTVRLKHRWKSPKKKVLTAYSKAVNGIQANISIHAVTKRAQWQKLEEDVAENGVRNAWMFAIAPTASTSLIAGSTAGIDPIFNKFFVEEKKNAVIPQTAPNLNDETIWYYKEAHQIDQHWSIRAAGRRQRHIDQAQSFNLYITPDYHSQGISGPVYGCMGERSKNRLLLPQQKLGSGRLRKLQRVKRCSFYTPYISENGYQ